MEASALQLDVPVARAPGAPVLLRLRSDEQLVALFRAGSEEAFGAIHDRFRVRLLAYVRRMLPPGPRANAEDVLQDVFLRAYGALRADERPVALRAWLYRVAHNRCVDELRRPGPQPAELPDQEGDARLDPAVAAERRERLRRLVADLGRLPQQQRSALLMRELEGFSYRELGSALGLSQPAVKSVLVRARVGLAAAAEARDACCEEIRDDLAASRDRRVRSSARARRHLRDCGACRSFDDALRATTRDLGALLPGPGILGALLQIAGVGGLGGGVGSAAAGGGAVAAGGTAAAGGGALSIAATKVAVAVCCVVAGAGGAATIHETARAPARAAAPQQAPARPVATIRSAVATPAPAPGPAAPVASSEPASRPAAETPTTPDTALAVAAPVQATTGGQPAAPAGTAGQARGPAVTGPPQPATEPVTATRPAGTPEAVPVAAAQGATDVASPVPAQAASAAQAPGP